MQLKQEGLDESIVKRLEDRISALEAELTQLRLTSVTVTPAQVDAALRALGKKTLNDGRPQLSYFNTRFRSLDPALVNIKALANEVGQRFRKARLENRKVDHPTRIELKSKLCTQADVELDWANFWVNELKLRPTYHRKHWEVAYIAQAIWSAGKLVSGARGLGFACGHESLPSLFAKYGAQILATDLASDRPEAKAWAATNQHASSVAAVLNRKVCPDEELLQNVVFRSVDMNDIDRDLDGMFDFCWSTCALEHLGSVEKGFDFIENSLRTLKPGGVAVHTTAFTFDSGPLRDNVRNVLYNKEKIIEFVEKLQGNGFSVAQLDFSPGDGLLDAYADDLTRHAHIARMQDLLHLKVISDGFVCTCIGLIINVPSE